ncbi:hypothetical protein [Pseudomonas sp. UM16]|uniref:hypothetical protein n=1 Tax=Pseudomonas sp. UM16 TaxID=3158962 RepID=UPI00398F9023
MLKARLLCLLATVVQMLPRLSGMHLGFVTLRPQLVALRAQAVDLRLALNQQLLQIGQTGYRSMSSSCGHRWRWCLT